MKIRKYRHKTRIRSGKKYICNPVFSDHWLRLTPEESVRQNVIQTLHQQYGYPYELFVTELAILQTDREQDYYRRADISIFLPSRMALSDGTRIEYQTYITIECKKGVIPLTEEHLQQGLNYCRDLKSFYLILTNGKETLIYAIEDNEKFYLIEDIPTYDGALAEEWIPLFRFEYISGNSRPVPTDHDRSE